MNLKLYRKSWYQKNKNRLRKKRKIQHKKWVENSRKSNQERFYKDSLDYII